MRKWKLMLTTLPIVAVVLGIDWAMGEIWQWPGAVEFSDVSPILTAVAFLMGFMLAGTMTDFKEAEKLPGEMACLLEAIEDAVALASTRKGLDEAALRAKVFDVTRSLCEWFKNREDLTPVRDAIGSLQAVLVEADKLGATPLAVRASTELSSLRKLITRTDVIGRTGFLAPGYALLEVMVTATVLLLLACKFKSDAAEYILIGFITLVYVYMLRLIRDIDDPFELSAFGSAEVDLSPLHDYRDRAQMRLSAAAPAPAPSVQPAAARSA